MTDLGLTFAGCVRLRGDNLQGGMYGGFFLSLREHMFLALPERPPKVR